MDDPVKVLLAEDEYLIAFSLKIELESLGYQVTTVHEGSKAVTMTRQLRPDVILMDIAMGPGMDGIAATREIMADTPTPVIMLTAHNERHLREGASRAGAVNHLSKPVTGPELHRAIQQAVGARRRVVHAR